MADRVQAEGVAEAWLVMNGLPRIYAPSLAILLLDTAIRNIAEMTEDATTRTDLLQKERAAQVKRASVAKDTRAEIVNFELIRKEQANAS